MTDLDNFLDCLVLRLTRRSADDPRLRELKRLIEWAREDAKRSTDPIRPAVPNVTRRALNASMGPGKPPKLIPYAGKYSRGRG
jgi:hypothetical protein